MYLSKLDLNLKTRIARKCVSYPYSVKGFMYRAIPYDRENEKVLFRLDLTNKGSTLLVQSVYEPDWEKIKFVSSSVTKEYNPNIKNDDIWRFRLRANPCKKPPGSKNRIALISKDEQTVWFERQALKFGFEIGSINIKNEDNLNNMIKGYKKFNGEVKPFKLFSVLFEGILKVIDSEEFLKCLESGIGFGKRTGFGLLSIARCYR